MRVFSLWALRRWTSAPEMVQYLWYLALVRWPGLVVIAVVLGLGARWGMPPPLLKRSALALAVATAANLVGTALYAKALRHAAYRTRALRWGYLHTVVDLLTLLYGLHVLAVGSLRLATLLLVVFFGGITMVFPLWWSLSLLGIATVGYLALEVAYFTGRLPLWNFSGQTVTRSPQEAFIEGLVALSVTLINATLLYLINLRLRQTRGQAQAREQWQTRLQRLVAHGLRSENLEQLRQRLLPDLCEVTEAQGVLLYITRTESMEPPIRWAAGALRGREEQVLRMLEPLPTHVPERTEAFPVVLSPVRMPGGWLQPLRLPFGWTGQGYEGWLFLWYDHWPHDVATSTTALRQVADTVTLLVARAMALEDLRQQVSLLSALTRAIHRLSQTLDRDTLAQLVVEQACQLLGAPRGALYLFSLSPEQRRLYCAYALNLPQSYVRFVETHYARLPGFRLISAAEGPVLHFPDLAQAPQVLQDIARKAPFTFRALTLVRIASSEHLLGALALYWETPRWLSFTEQDALYLLASQAGAMLYNAQLYAYLRDEAQTDPLTGLYNRRALFRLWHQEMERTRDHHRALSLLLVDLDRFKLINDRFGHRIGDLVLRQVAGFLRQWFPSQFPIARYGGDEFLVLLPGVPGEQAQAMALQLQQDFLRFKPDVPEPLQQPLGISVGVAAFPEDGQTLQELIQVADARMYRQKAAQRQHPSMPVEDQHPSIPLEEDRHDRDASPGTNP